MFQRLWFVLICTIAITSAQPDSIEDKSPDEKEKQCKFDHLQFMALIQKRVQDKEGVMHILASISGTFITYEHVLTTASSWIKEMITSDDAKRNLEHFILIVGPIDFNEPTNMSTHRSQLISHAMVHPLFNTTGYQHDICIVMSWLRIRDDIIRPAALWYNVEQKGSSNECRRGAILGWGDTSNTRTPESLYTLSCHEVELVENAEVCSDFPPSYDKNYIYIQDYAPQIGDMGGPVFCDQEMIGILTPLKSRSGTKQTFVATNVESHLKFIAEFVREYPEELKITYNWPNWEPWHKEYERDCTKRRTTTTESQAIGAASTSLLMLDICGTVLVLVGMFFARFIH